MPDFIPLFPDAFKHDVPLAPSCPQCYNVLVKPMGRLPKLQCEDGVLVFCSAICKRRYKLDEGEEPGYGDRLAEGFFMLGDDI